MTKGLSGLLSDVLVVRTNDDTSTNTTRPGVLSLNLTSWIVDPTSLSIGMLSDVFLVQANPAAGSTDSGSTGSTGSRKPTPQC